VILLGKPNKANSQKWGWQFASAGFMVRLWMTQKTRKRCQLALMMPD
jgi:hypothetical protein